MGNTQEKGQDAYKHQELYEARVQKRKVISSWIFLLLAIITLVSVFTTPIYKYDYKRKSTKVENKYKVPKFEIKGEYTVVDLISKSISGDMDYRHFFDEWESSTTLKEGLEPFPESEKESKSILNVLTMVSAVLLIVDLICIVVALFMAVVVNKKRPASLKKITNYGVIEVLATLQFVILMANMIFARIDVAGKITNLFEFWLLMATSVIFVALSISLSTFDK